MTFFAENFSRWARRKKQHRTRREHARDKVNWASTAALIGLGVGSLVAATVSTLATVFARLVVTPPRKDHGDTRIYDVKGLGTENAEITLEITPETTVEGDYTLVFDNKQGVARIGEVLDIDGPRGLVRRRVGRVYSGNLAAATRGSWTGFLWPDPAEAGYDADDVLIATELGPAPAWRIAPLSPEDGGVEPPATTWALMVHGRGARRTEGIRAVATARALGMTSLLLSYRNDGDAPPAADGRYGLGTTEWRDVEAGLKYALDHSAEQVVVFGWSMGAAVALQLADRSAYRSVIRALVLDGPVINWLDVLEYQARTNRLPEAVGELGQLMITNSWGKRLTGLAAPVDLKAMDWVDRADELAFPTLILHSEDDDFVPIGPSAALAEARPDLVSLVRFTKARHTREWNVDSERWEKAVYAWLSLVLNMPRVHQKQLRA